MIPANQFQVHFRQLFDNVPRTLVLAYQRRHRFFTAVYVTASGASVEIQRQMDLHMFLARFADATFAPAFDLRLNQGAAHEIAKAMQLFGQGVALLFKLNLIQNFLGLTMCPIHMKKSSIFS